AGLRDAVRCQRALADQLPEVAAALLLGTRDEEGMGGEAVGGDRVGDPGAAVVELLEHEAGVQRTEPSAAQLLRHREVHESQLPRLAADVLGKALLVVAPGRDRNDLLGGEGVRRLLQPAASARG